MANKQNQEIFHSSLVIIKSKTEDCYLFSSMDLKKRPLYFGRKKLLGGNRDNGDRSPKETLQREIREEIMGKEKELKKFASAKILFDLREAILNERNLREYKSFLEEIPSKKGGLGKPITVYGHTYISEIPQKFFKITNENLKKGLKLSNEGAVEIVSLEKLLSGGVLFAYGSGKIMNSFLKDFYGIKKPRIPNPEKVKILKQENIPKTY